MSHYFSDVIRFLEAGQNIVVARIIHHTGSTPRTIGTGCVICKDGTIIGTIGGGVLEYEVQQKALTVFETKRSALIHFRLTGREAAQTDMLCGGIVDVFLEPISAADKTAQKIFGRIKTALVNHEKAALVTLAAEGLDDNQFSMRMLILAKGASYDTIGAFEEGINIDYGALLSYKKPQLEVAGKPGRTVFIEPVPAANNLFIFGAGHISTCLSPLAKMAGFGVIVIDDREIFANPTRFPDADQIIVSSFENAFDKISLGPGSYVAIVTRGHLHDQLVLRATLKHSPGYIGMIGSRNKRKIIYQSLMAEGVSEKTLKKVHSPIGLDIKAETPAEIAISIVAELIQVRAEAQMSK